MFSKFVAASLLAAISFYTTPAQAKNLPTQIETTSNQAVQGQSNADESKAVAYWEMEFAAITGFNWDQECHFTTALAGDDVSEQT